MPRNGMRARRKWNGPPPLLWHPTNIPSSEGCMPPRWSTLDACPDGMVRRTAPQHQRPEMAGISIRRPMTPDQILPSRHPQPTMSSPDNGNGGRHGNRVDGGDGIADHRLTGCRTGVAPHTAMVRPVRAQPGLPRPPLPRPRPRTGTAVTGRAALPRRTPGKAPSRSDAADPHRRAIGRARVAGAGPSGRWADDPETLRRVLDGLGAGSSAPPREPRS